MFFHGMPNVFSVRQNSVVSNVQNNVNVLLYLHGVLVSNKLNTRGLLTISRYIYDLRWFFPACMTITFKQALFGKLPSCSIIDLRLAK